MSVDASNIHFIVNPVSGASPAPFEHVGQAMAQTKCKTTLHVTKVNYSASDCVDDALKAGADLVVAYGGDGTVMEVANALHGKNIPMAIIPGGTANVISHELNIPQNPQQALDLIFNPRAEIRWLDAGRIDDKHFLLRLSIGLDAEVSLRPQREAKGNQGMLAYVAAALESIQELEPVQYEITLDDDGVEVVEGINCSVCNISKIGFGIDIGTGTKPDDGLLDIMILQSNHFRALLDITQNILTGALSLESEVNLAHFSAKKVQVSASDQRISYDGEALETAFPVTIECVPRYISIVTPEPQQEGGIFAKPE